MRRAAATALLAALLLLAAAPAFAGVSITKPFGGVHRDSLGADGLPSPEVAARRSAINTLVPVAVGAGLVAVDAGAVRSGALLIGGLIVAAVGIVGGPATGYTYGGLRERGASGAGLRMALIVGPPIVVAVAMRRDSHSGLKAGLAVGTMLAGTTLALGSAAWDVATVGGAVERHNHGLTSTSGLRLVPAVAPFSRAPGFAVSVGLGPGGD